MSTDINSITPYSIALVGIQSIIYSDQIEPTKEEMIKISKFLNHIISVDNLEAYHVFDCLLDLEESLGIDFSLSEAQIEEIFGDDEDEC